MPDARAVAEVLGALSYGERLAQHRAEENVALAPDGRTQQFQRQVAARERDNAALIEARVREMGVEGLAEPFRRFFDAFFERTVPTDWLEAQTFHYVGDALMSEFGDVLIPSLDPVSAVVIRQLSDRADQESFALDEITRGTGDDPAAAERVAAYARRVIGEALTQTRRALDETEAIRTLLGGEEGEKRMLLDLLQRHRARLDRMGIEAVE
ncbi:MAG: ferritin-like fold-containing protein [Actinomycetota bacterium]